MKINYLATMAAVSVLSLGVATSCSNPCKAKTQSDTEPATEVQANPCKAKGNPCTPKN